MVPLASNLSYAVKLFIRVNDLMGPCGLYNRPFQTPEFGRESKLKQPLVLLTHQAEKKQASAHSSPATNCGKKQSAFHQLMLPPVYHRFTSWLHFTGASNDVAIDVGDRMHHYQKKLIQSISHCKQFSGRNSQGQALSKQFHFPQKSQQFTFS